MKPSPENSERPSPYSMPMFCTKNSVTMLVWNCMEIVEAISSVMYMSASIINK